MSAHNVCSKAYCSWLNAASSAMRARKRSTSLPESVPALVPESAPALATESVSSDPGIGAESHGAERYAVANVGAGLVVGVGAGVGNERSLSRFGYGRLTMAKRPRR